MDGASIAAIITASSVLIAGLIAGIIKWNNSRHTIVKNEMDEIRKELVRLQERITNLEDENEKWRKRYNRLYEYVMILRGILIQNNIPVPPMPNFDEPDAPPEEVKVVKKKNRKK